MQMRACSSLEPAALTSSPIEGLPTCVSDLTSRSSALIYFSLSLVRSRIFLSSSSSYSSLLTCEFSSPADCLCSLETNRRSGSNFGCVLYTLWIVFRSLAREIFTSFGTVVNSRDLTCSSASVASGDVLMDRYSLNDCSFGETSLSKQYRSSETYPERMLCALSIA